MKIFWTELSDSDACPFPKAAVPFHFGARRINNNNTNNNNNNNNNNNYNNNIASPIRGLSR